MPNPHLPSRWKLQSKTVVLVRAVRKRHPPPLLNLDNSSPRDENLAVGEQKANIDRAMIAILFEARKIRNRSHRTGAGRISEPRRRGTPAERSQRNSMRCSVAVFPVGLSWNCAALLPPGGRASRFLCLRKPRNDRKRVRLSMFRIPSTRFLSRLREWNFRDCFGFDAEKRRPRTGSQDVLVLCSCGQRNKKNSRSRFREQEANASTWLAASA